MVADPAAQTTAHGAASVVIIDDSVVVRGLFSRWLTEHPAFDVVATASDGRTGLAAVLKHQPRIVILDIEMPVMDGLSALPEILKVSPGSSVLIASSVTSRSARLSLQCLELGATDLQPKPESNRDLTMSLTFREELLRKLEGLLRADPAKGWRSRRLPAPRPGHDARRAPDPERGGAPGPRANSGASSSERKASTQVALAELRPVVSPRAVLIGASTGGPRAIIRLLVDAGEALARCPVLVAQHMPPLFTQSFAEQISSHTGLDAREACDGDVPEAGRIYVAPGGQHLRIERHGAGPRLRLDDGPAVKFCRPSVDVLFQDAAYVYGASALAVILTGMGSDGCDGARLLKTAGARILVQDEATSVVWGMPGAAARAGLSDLVLPIDEMGAALRGLLNMGLAA